MSEHSAVSTKVEYRIFKFPIGNEKLLKLTVFVERGRLQPKERENGKVGEQLGGMESTLIVTSTTFCVNEGMVPRVQFAEVGPLQVGVGEVLEITYENFPSDVGRKLEKIAFIASVELVVVR